jgi:hypothetical protein
MSNNVRAARALAVGVKVRVISTPPETRKRWPNWADDMDETCRGTGYIDSIMQHDPPEEEIGYHVGGWWYHVGGWWYRSEWLEVLHE